MDRFTNEIIKLINEEAEKRAKKLIDRRVSEIIKNLSSYLSVKDIATVTQLTINEVRASLQEIVDKYNNINRMGNENYKEETIETFFDLKKFKHNRNKEDSE